jgi:hypothetical protein
MSLLLLLTLLLPAAHAQQAPSCACPDGRVLVIDDLMRSARPEANVDAAKEWRGEINWNAVKSPFGSIAELQVVGTACQGKLAHDWYSKAGGTLHSAKTTVDVADLCSMARLNEDFRAVSHGHQRLKDLEESGELDEALRGSAVRAGALTSPYPRALGPYSPGQGVYAIKDGNGVKRGQMGFILSAAKNGELIEVGFYCRKVTFFEKLGGLPAGALSGRGYRRCERTVSWSSVAPTTDDPSMHDDPGAGGPS